MTGAGGRDEAGISVRLKQYCDCSTTVDRGHNDCHFEWFYGTPLHWAWTSTLGLTLPLHWDWPWLPVASVALQTMGPGQDQGGDRDVVRAGVKLDMRRFGLRFVSAIGRRSVLRLR